MLIELDKTGLRDFHARLADVMAAVQDVNKNYRGRPSTVKRAYLNEKHPKQAPLGVLLLDGELEAFYSELAQTVTTQF
jgi:hypothetical protein